MTFETLHNSGTTVRAVDSTGRLVFRGEFAWGDLTDATTAKAVTRGWLRQVPTLDPVPDTGLTESARTAMIAVLERRQAAEPAPAATRKSRRTTPTTTPTGDDQTQEDDDR